MTLDPVLFSFHGDDILVAPPICGLIAGPEFLRSVESWCRHRHAPGQEVLMVDLTPVTDWDMSMFRTLVWARRRCREAGGDLVLALPRAPIFTPHEADVVRQLFTVVDHAETRPVA